MRGRFPRTTMPTVKANQVRKGNVLILDGELYVCTDHEFRKPGKGSSFNQIKCKHLSTGSFKSMKMSTDETLEVAFLQTRPCTYSYPEGDSFVFMDKENFELYYLNADLVGDKMKFVRDNQEVSVTFHEDIAISLELPAHVVLQVTEAEISAKGDTVTNDKKGAVCETGLAVRVPPYIDSGEWIKVHTDTGDFLSRADGPDA
ncbi:MAG: elongation factor P [Planctomycetes bacterium]|nr:elongation factor P [Planctomycetota bacterium]